MGFIKNNYLKKINLVFALIVSLLLNTTANYPVQAKTTSVNDSSDVKLEVSVDSTWEEGGYEYNLINVYIWNKSGKDISNWTVDIPLKNKDLDQIWNAKPSYKDNGLSFEAVDYNNTIVADSNICFGFIVKGKKDNNNKPFAQLSYDNSVARITNYQTNTNNNNSNNNNNKKNTGTNKIVPAKDVPPPTTDDWLYTDGNKIVDKYGNEVWLTGVNWFGYNTGTNTFDGLWAADLNTSIAAIADRGFNVLRIPISSELILQWAEGDIPDANFNQAINHYLVGMNSLEIFDYVIGQCRANGLKIIIDIHSAKTDPMGHMKPLWVEGDITEADYLYSLSWIAERYKNDDTIIAYDLKNEPHGKPNEAQKAIWNDSKAANNWKYVAEKAAFAVLSKNPNVLVLVEGIEIYPKNIKNNKDYSSTNPADYYFNWWGGNLRGVKDYPIDLGKYQNKLVYSPHDYGPSVYAQPWFEGNFTYKTLYEDCWKDNWMFIHEEEIAPILIGEWGGHMTEPNLKWMVYLRKLIKDNQLHHTFWCFNANSGDTGGLVLDDFTTWDEEKYGFVKSVLWQKDGKFVGLDHKIPLGKNGISLSEYYKK